MWKKWMTTIIGILIVLLAGCGKENVETHEPAEQAQTEYSFLDWTREFGGTDEDIRVITTDKKIFEKYLDTYTDGKPGMPFFLELDGGEVVRILEKPMA